MAKELHIMIGGTGTGKSALAKRMKKELGLEVFCPDDVEEKYLNYNDEKINQIVDSELKTHLESNKSFILDGKCLVPKERIEIINRAHANGFTVFGHDFGPGNVVSILRRLMHPRRFSNKYWEEVYESDKKLYISPDPDEGFEKIFYPAR